MSLLKSFSKFWVAPLLIAVSAVSVVQSAKALDNGGSATVSISTPNPYQMPALAEINKLLDAKVESEVVLAYVQNSPSTFHLNATEIIALKERGASSEILKAILQHQGRSPAPVVSAPQTPNAAQAPDNSYASDPAYPYAYADSGSGYPYFSSYGYDYPYYSSYGYPSFYVGWPYYYPYGFSRYYRYGNHYPFGYGGRLPGLPGFRGSFVVRNSGTHNFGTHNFGTFRSSPSFHTSSSYSGVRSSGSFGGRSGGGFVGHSSGSTGHSGGFGGHSGGSSGGGHFGGGRR